VKYALVVFILVAFVFADPVAAQNWQEYSYPSGLSPNRSRAQIAMLRIKTGGRPLHEHVDDLIERSRPA
jgi:hypothetical protein